MAEAEESVLESSLISSKKLSSSVDLVLKVFLKV